MSLLRVRINGLFFLVDKLELELELEFGSNTAA